MKQQSRWHYLNLLNKNHQKTLPQFFFQLPFQQVDHLHHTQKLFQL